MSDQRGADEREGVTLADLLDRLSLLPPERAAKILANARPMPTHPEADDDKASAPAPQFASWEDFLHRTTEAERLRWCAKKAKVANRERLMSGRPDMLITSRGVLAVIGAARGRCAYCNSLAVQHRPSRPNGAPAPWAAVGRRVGSLGHVVGRIHGGSNAVDNLVWSCLWCNTWQEERRLGATDHGGHFPADA